jgi:type I restriction enzyme M protein
MANIRKFSELSNETAGKHLQQNIIAMLNSMDSSIVYKNRSAFKKVLRKRCAEYGLSLSAPIQKTVLKALSQRYETADICLDAIGQQEADTSLRDNENVPLKEDIDTYFKREVFPHMTDVWIDKTKTVIGYEINITKHFYKYKPLRSLELESEIQGVMSEVVDI